MILVHISKQGRTQWRTPPRFDPCFLLNFHKIDLLISSYSRSLCLLIPPNEPFCSNLNSVSPIYFVKIRPPDFLRNIFFIQKYRL